MLKRLILSLLLILPLLALAVIMTACTLQEKLLFHPEPLPADYRFSVPPGYHFKLREITLPVNGARLSGLHLALERPRGALLFFHGNAGALDGWLITLAPLTNLGWDIYVFDYRGFGKSSGRIKNQAQMLEDSNAMAQWVKKDFPGTIVPVGYSIGSGLAAYQAQRLQAPAVILLAPYYSFRDLIGEKAPWFPSFLLRYQLPSIDYLRAAPGRITLMHGERDPLIPPHHSRRLKEELGARAQLVLVPADHGSLLDPQWHSHLAEALNAVVPAQP